MRIALPRNSYLTLTYDPSQLADGIGAQLDRSWHIYSCAKTFNLGFLFTPIEDIVYHPLDHWKNQSEKTDFLREVNTKFAIPSDCPASFQTVKTYPALTKRLFFQNYVESLFFRRNILIRTIEIHTWINPTYIQIDFGIKARKQSAMGCSVVAHIRNAQPILGIEQKRNLDITYYLALLEVIIEELRRVGTPYTVTILTDHPQSDLVIPIEMIDLKHLPMLHLSADSLAQSKIEIRGFDIQQQYFPSDSNTKVLHGGNPLDAFDIMAAADILIMSRSKFSNVGGYLNSRGKVIMPPEVGDSVIPRNWIPARKFIKIKSDWKLSKHPALTILKKTRIIRWTVAILRIPIKSLQVLRRA